MSYQLYVHDQDWRSLHVESENSGRNFCTLKNKYDLTLCQSHLHTASKIFVCHKKKFRYIFSIFHIRSKHFERCFDSSEPPYKRTPKSRMAIVKFTLVSQHKALYIDPCTLSSQKLVVVFMICGSSIASKSIKLSHWYPEVNFELLEIILLLLDKEGELYISGLDGPNISFHFHFLRSKRTTK